MALTKGTHHDFDVISDAGENVCNIWHSDRGEWSISTSDGPVYRRASRSDAIEMVSSHLLAGETIEDDVKDCVA